jgi:hypothetical protein
MNDYPVTRRNFIKVVGPYPRLDGVCPRPEAAECRNPGSLRSFRHPMHDYRRHANRQTGDLRRCPPRDRYRLRTLIQPDLLQKFNEPEVVADRVEHRMDFEEGEPGILLSQCLFQAKQGLIFFA